MVIKCCHVCGTQFYAELRTPDQEPPFYCLAHLPQAPWYRRMREAVYANCVAHNLHER